MSKRTLEHLIPTDLDFQCENARVLVFDDDQLITRFVALCLKNAGFANVRCLNSTLDAIQQIDEYRPDLILLDIEMPHLDGLELLELIRADEKFEEILVVMLSGADKASKYRSLNLGAVDFIDKPVRADELEVRIRKALRVV